MKSLFLVCLLLVNCRVAFSKDADESPEIVVRMDLKDCDLRDVLLFYKRVTQKRVWVDPSISLAVDIPLAKMVSAKEAATLIEKVLLQNYGIALKNGEGNNVYAQWSDDPKYADLVQKYKTYPPRTDL